MHWDLSFRILGYCGILVEVESKKKTVFTIEALIILSILIICLSLSFYLSPLQFVSKLSRTERSECLLSVCQWYIPYGR